MFDHEPAMQLREVGGVPETAGSARPTAPGGRYRCTTAPAACSHGLPPATRHSGRSRHCQRTAAGAPSSRTTSLHAGSAPSPGTEAEGDTVDRLWQPPRSKPAVTVATFQPCPSSPMRLATGTSGWPPWCSNRNCNDQCLLCGRQSQWSDTRFGSSTAGRERQLSDGSSWVSAFRR